FYQLKLKSTPFHDCSLQEVDFSQCDLTSVIFDNCDLSMAIFDNTILEKADLRNAYNYQINPEHNHIRKAKFSSNGLAGLLMQYDIDIYN
ncbi:MAG TPA: pentapeptide repeat-containing protein, partial [Chitinophagales bacterium]|nr:pentapeptide repeat-containing protein [Chitinophagales bacterium]